VLESRDETRLLVFVLSLVVAGERVRERAGEMIYHDVTLADLRYALNWFTRDNIMEVKVM
jgi:hypothetical protein